MFWSRGSDHLPVCLAALLGAVLVLPLAGCGDDAAAAPDGAPPADAGAPDAPPGDILERLNAIPGMACAEPPAPVPPARPLPDGYRFFTCGFDQPADHAHPEGLHFSQ